MIKQAYQSGMTPIEISNLFKININRVEKIILSITEKSSEKDLN